MRIREKRVNFIWKRLIPALCAVFILLSSGVLSYAAETAGPNSAEGGTVVIRVEGSVEYLDRQALLERINEIRKEACDEGVRDPADGIPMTPADYTPLQWSSELESIAVLRAAESTILQDHVRPDGTDCFTAAEDGVAYTMETLAWGFGGAAAALEGWYSEKASYVEETGKPAGHYMALINPEIRYVGIADLEAPWQRDACAGAFAPTGTAADLQADGDHTEESSGAEAVTQWNILLKESYLEQVITRAVEITAVRIFNAAAPK